MVSGVKNVKKNTVSHWLNILFLKWIFIDMPWIAIFIFERDCPKCKYPSSGVTMKIVDVPEVLAFYLLRYDRYKNKKITNLDESRIS